MIVSVRVADDSVGIEGSVATGGGVLVAGGGAMVGGGAEVNVGGMNGVLVGAKGVLVGRMMIGVIDGSTTGVRDGKNGLKVRVGCAVGNRKIWVGVGCNGLNGVVASWKGVIDGNGVLVGSLDVVAVMMPGGVGVRTPRWLGEVSSSTAPRQ